MNVVLVPALILLLGLVFYKKIWEPKRGASKPEKATSAKAARMKPQKVQKLKASKANKPSKPSKAAKGRMATSSGRMGSVL